MNKPIRVLMVLTGGLMNDGITNGWYKYVQAIKRNQELDKYITIDFVNIADRCDYVMVEKLSDKGCEIINLPCRSLSTLRYITSLVKVIKKNKYNVVHANGSSAIMVIEMFAAWLAGVKVRVSHSRNTFCENYKVHRICKPFFNLFCNTRFACGTDAGKWLFGDKDFTVVPNGLEFKKYQYNVDKRSEMRSKLGVEDKIVVGHVGKLNEQKNHKYLLDVFNVLVKYKKNAVLFIIGDGPLREETEEKVKTLDLQDKVVFTGEISNVPDYLQAMDFMLLPSLYEGLPNVVIEWQAMGLPVLVSDTVTKECAVCDLVSFLPINVKPEIWADSIQAISNRHNNREEAEKKAKTALSEHGFNINDNAVKLIGYYKNKLK